MCGVGSDRLEEVLASHHPFDRYPESGSEVIGVREFRLGDSRVSQRVEIPSVKRSRSRYDHMVKFTAAELKLLTALASDQLFRREFIDPKIPGYQSNFAELGLGKKLVERLKVTMERDAQKAQRSRRTRTPQPSRRNGASG
jgi:hypothetical protein